MKRLYPTLVLMIILLVAGPAQSAPDEIGGADIIDRVDRVLRVSPDTADTWYAGVSSLDAWPARLERALLETLGPADLRDARAGVQTLEALLKEQSTGVRVTEGARETLSIVVELARRAVSLEEQRNRAEAELEREREAHQTTLDKLKALRDIDHQLDEREENGG